MASKREGNRVYYCENLRNLIALNPKTGNEVWRYTNSGVAISTPALTDDAIYVRITKNRTNHGIGIFDSGTGEKIGFVAVSNVPNSSIALSDSLAVVTVPSSEVYAFEPCSFDIAGHCFL
ncbi:PQQ-binding-like beta-propeller repeat protein [Haladaptatus sp. DFWS20]|uniref:outer membrane protein assembly factor BamB family protein n=1 Tax=Haladaptatus sp. DFWS20 TaxID=3403467 RepID=UPI003EB99AC1